MKKKIVFTDADQNIVEYDDSPLSWRVSAYAIIIQNDSLLIIKNKEEKLYDVPGGGVEFGESIEEALIREAQEEAGAHIRPGELITAIQGYFYHRGQKKFYQTLQLFYHAQLLSELNEPTEKQNIMNKFVPLDKLDLYPLPPTVKEALNQIEVLS